MNEHHHFNSHHSPDHSTSWEHDVQKFQPLVNSGLSPGVPLSENVDADQSLEQIIQSRFADIHRREQQFAIRMLQFEQEQRQFRLQLRQREDDFQQAESQLAERLADCEVKFRELSAQRHEFDRQSAELANLKSNLRQHLAKELDQEKLDLQRDRLQLVQEQARLNELLASHQTQHQSYIARRELELKQERERLWQDLSAEWHTQRDEYLQEKQRWEAQRAAEQQEIALQHQLCQQAMQHAEQELETYKLSRYQDWEKERLLQENRIQFQQQHLEKSRTELEQTQHDFRVERQRERQMLQQQHSLLNQRKHQLELQRMSLYERERSLDREREILVKVQHAHSSNAEIDQQSLVAQKIALEQERQQQHAEFQRQQDLLAIQLQQVESRQNRIEKVRTELESTHLTTLELRLAVEESWAQMTAPGNEEAVQQKILQARKDVEHYYQDLAHQLLLKREEIFRVQQQFEEQRLQHLDERQSLLAWISNRDQELQTRDHKLHQQAQQIAEYDRNWQTQREEWLKERLEAELVIRKLLDEINVLTQTSEHNLSVSNEHSTSAVTLPLPATTHSTQLALPKAG